MPAPRASLGFIGAGNMAEAIARGVLRAGLYAAEELVAADPSPDRRTLFRDDLSIRCVSESTEVAAGSQIVMLAVKPQVLAAALDQIKSQLAPDALIITIVAAISTTFIETALATPANPKPRVIRVMPNTPMLVGSGMSALTKGANATEEDLVVAEKIFDSSGKTLRANQSQMDAITALSGSGPAYLFYLVEAMAAAGAKLGLSEADATLLAKQTVIGSAQLLEQSKDSPADLRRKVTSPGGTTQAAIESLQAGDFLGLMAQALAAAERRGKELAK